MEKYYDMPKGCRYMSEDTDLLPYLRQFNKFILNKTVTGCGGTSLFLNSSIDVVIISPRLQALKDKHEQHPDTFFFHSHYTSNGKVAEDIKRLMSELNSYISYCGSTPFTDRKSAKILVTLDSCEKVIDVLEKCGVIDRFLFVVDEFQCLMGDATFKGTTDVNFLIRLDNEAKDICYLSATPIPDMYLDFVPQFNGLPYIKLEWDPDVLEEPNVREIQMKKDESAEKICSRLIKDFRANGYFARKVVNGQVVYSTEACIFLNEVRSIINIIVKNNLKPDEVTVLCSEGKVSGLPKGFKTGGLCTDRDNPCNKTFTFCTKASFEGVDFYSTNAMTFVFINAGKEWQTLDIMLDIPQILGRQRLDINPFRHDAIIYYKTKPDCMTKAEFEAQQKAMELETERFINDFNSAPDSMKERLVKLVRDRAEDKMFVDDYVDVLQMNGRQTLGINTLVQVAKWNQWRQRTHYYSHSCKLTTSIQSAITMNVKPQKVKDFETWYYSAKGNDRLKGYSDFRYTYPCFDSFILQNPFIDIRYHSWFNMLGYNELVRLNFDLQKVEQEYDYYCNHEPIIQKCRETFTVGNFYTKPKVKSILQQIYDSLGLVGKKAKAAELERYMNVKERMITDDEGNRKEGYLILP
ncbi:DEAD/DEAH box helicase family protein [Marseilla massiliensis]|uniref:hypothetical protein n=1 Tax=Marseilla massiliensis TaxID=1841864 RepID=UPI0020112F3C|nr:hypothetical protein [Marseilla massiliensis]MCL1610917.1 hypothetical protein [Marseilla massiliensis]